MADTYKQRQKQKQGEGEHPAIRSVRKAFGLTPSPEPDEDEEERRKRQKRQKRGSLADIISNNLKVLGND